MTNPQIGLIELGILALCTVIFVVPMIRGFVSGAPFVPTSWRTARRMAKLAKITGNDRVIDPGCGDGRLLIACMENSAAHTEGYDTFFAPLMLARFYTRGYRSRCRLHWDDSRKRSFADFTVVVCYMLPESLGRMKRQFRQLPPGARIVSHAFSIPGWIHSHREEPSEQSGGSVIYVYVRGEEGDGE